MFRILAYLCYAFAVADIVLANTGICDMTGVIWSPLVAAGLGWVFMKLHDKQTDRSES
ncbi:MAG: hypothetical protein K8S62_15625 [Candidatus Sabulitectum sp.]|nr:hypothetical protein [Candidatus Sabulitectum sp.]